MKTRIKRRAAILILAAVLLTILCPTALAEAEIPKEEVSPYRIVLTAPAAGTAATARSSRYRCKTQVVWAGTESNTA